MSAQSSPPFHLTFPKGPSSMSFESDSGAQSALYDKRVLVVEDNSILGFLIESLLSHEGAEMIGPAASVDQALELIEVTAGQGGLSAAVLDYRLQGETAMPIADKLAAMGVPFLFATGYAKVCDRGVHGDAPILLKPFGLEEFTQALAALVSRKEQPCSDLELTHRRVA